MSERQSRRDSDNHKTEVDTALCVHELDVVDDGVKISWRTEDGSVATQQANQEGIRPQRPCNRHFLEHNGKPALQKSEH